MYCLLWTCFSLSFNPTALKKAKIVHNFGLLECNSVNISIAVLQTSMEGDKKVPIFVLVIHLSGSGGSQNLQSSTEGWVITRKLQDFQAVHEKLIQVYRHARV